jgi:hypothetical protein
MKQDSRAPTPNNVTKYSSSSMHIRKKQVSYNTCLVTYFDILGFRNLLASETAGRISRILRVVKESSRRDKESDRDFDRLYESFSDLTLRSIGVSSPEFLLARPELLLYELESIAKVQIELVRREGILVRGGIAIGVLVKSWGLVYGDALVKAYELEKKATHPRVLIHPELVEALGKLERQGDHNVETSQLVAVDRGRSYVDYLRYRSRLVDWEAQAKFFRLHKQLIEQGLSRFSSNPHVRAKYRWLRRYHNSRVPRVPLPSFEDLKIA